MEAKFNVLNPSLYIVGDNIYFGVYYYDVIPASKCVDEIVRDHIGELKVSEAVALGKMITCGAAGKGEVADAAGEWVGAIAYEIGAADNDVIGVEVTGFEAHSSDV